MKNLLKALLALTLITAFLLTGCEMPDASSESSSNTSDLASSTVGEQDSTRENSTSFENTFSDIPEGAEPDTLSADEYAVLEQKLMNEYIPELGLVLSYCEWSDAEDIPIEALIDWYRSSHMDSKGYVSAQDFESAVQKHFYISKTHLRSSQYYEETTNTYSTILFYDTFVDFQIKDIKKYGETVKVTLLCSWLGRERFTVDTLCELTLYVAETDEVKFIKCLHLGSTEEFVGKTVNFNFPIFESDLAPVKISLDLAEEFSISDDGKKLLYNDEEIGAVFLFNNKEGDWEKTPINPMLFADDCYILTENIKLDIITYPSKNQEGTKYIGYFFYVNLGDVYFEVSVIIDMNKPQDSVSLVCQVFNIAQTVAKK